MSKYLALCKLSKSDLIWIIDRLLIRGAGRQEITTSIKRFLISSMKRISLICVKRTNMLRLRIKSGWNTVIW